MVFASSLLKKKSFWKTRFISSDPNDLCDRWKLLLLEEQARKIFDIIDEKYVALVEKLLEYKCISTKQQKSLLLKRLN